MVDSARRRLLQISMHRNLKLEQPILQNVSDNDVLVTSVT